MATIMARMTRSGTFVGPGTNRKLRPGILGCDIVSSLKARSLGSLRSGLMASEYRVKGVKEPYERVVHESDERVVHESEMTDVPGLRGVPASVLPEDR